MKSYVADASPISREALLAGVDGDVELLRELLALFPSTIAGQLAALRTSIARRDAPSLGTAAHRLKGALANFGGEAATGCAARLEHLAGAGDLAAADAALVHLEREVDHLARALSAIAG